MFSSQKKSLINAAWIVLAISTLPLSTHASDNDRGGSLGTQGGGNLPSWSQLVPEVVEIYRVYAFDLTGPALGRRSNRTTREACLFGQNERTPYTHHETAFRSNIQTEEQSEESNFLRRGVRDPAPFFRDIVHIDLDRRTYGTYLIGNECFEHNPSHFQIYADGQLTSLDNLYQQFLNASDLVLSQMRLSEPRSIGTALEFRSKLKRFAFFGLLDPMTLQQLMTQIHGSTPEVQALQTEINRWYHLIESSETKISELLGEHYNTVHVAVNLLLRSSVTPDGQCDLDRFNELRSYIRSAHLATSQNILGPRYFDELLNGAQLRTEEERLVFDRAVVTSQTAAADLRLRTQEYILGTLNVICEVHGTQQDLELEPVRRRRRQR